MDVRLSGRPAVRPAVCHKNLNVELFSETIKATVTKFGTKVLCDVALQNIYSTMTFTQGQGQKGQGQRSPKMTLPFFSETIKDTNIKFGTKILCDVALQNISSRVTFTQGQGQKGQGQMSPKSNIGIFLGNY